MALFVSVQKAILSGEAFHLTVDGSAEMTITLEVAGLPRRFGLRIGTHDHPKSDTHLVDADLPVNCLVTNWGAAPFGSLVLITATAPASPPVADAGAVAG